MAKEIERKFLVTSDDYKRIAHKRIKIAQAYIHSGNNGVVRVRLADDRAFLTVKSRNKGMTRDEWEFEIPIADARQMLGMAVGRVIEKTRHVVPYEGFTWEVDEFHGALAPLVIAEVEVPAEDCSPTLPSFVGTEVTGNPDYYNSVLALGQ